MYRYLMFANDRYYPVHGMYGCKLKTNDYFELLEVMETHLEEYDMVQYYDVETDKYFNMNRMENGFEFNECKLEDLY